MRKQTLASLATLLLTASAATANPWASYDWASNTFHGQQPNAMQSYRAPAYPQAVRPQSFRAPIAQPPVVTQAPVATVQAPAQQPAETVPVNYTQQVSHGTAYPPATNCPTGACQSQRYAPAPTPGPAVNYAPAPAPVVNYAPPAETYVNPSYVNDGYSYGTCAPAAPARSYTINGFAEALFLNREDSLNGRNFFDGPNDSGFGYSDIGGDANSAGWRVGAEILFGNPCSDWSHGFGFTVANFGDFDSSTSGELDLGLAFDAGTKGTDPSTLAGCYVLSQNTFFASLARVASMNTLTNNEQDEFEGLGPDTSTVAFDPGRTTGSENFALPAYRADYRSNIDSVGAHFVLAKRGPRRVRYGVGWKQYNISEYSFVGVTGPLHATDASFFTGAFPQPGVVNNGLEHGSFLDDTRNDGSNPGLVYLGPAGAEDGFDSANFDNNGANDGIGPDLVEILSSQEATNRLNGINFFTSAQLICHNRFDLVANANLGIYLNEAFGHVTERYSELTGNGSVYGRVLDDEANVVSMVSSLGLDAGYWLTCNLRAYAGYEVIFVNGVALSTEQESGINGTTYHIKHDGDFLLHGAKVGLEFLY